MKRRAPLYASLLLLAAAPAGATKLDLSSNIEVRAAKYTDLPYAGGDNDQSVYSENATLGFVIKDIKLEKTQDSSMDVGIVLQSVGAGSSTNTLSGPQFTDAVNRLPHSNGTPYLHSAYVRIYKFLRPDITATLGRQDFVLGQGITLSGGDLGLPGGRLELAGVFRNIKADIFVFRPFKGGRSYKIYGAAAYYPGSEGLWQAYHFWEQEGSPYQDILFNTKGTIKKFTGLRYFLAQKQLSFDGEVVMQRGEAKKFAGGTGKYEGYAFMMKGAWNQDLTFFGQSRLRLAYGRSSGNPGTAQDTDKAFFPAFGSKNNGFERKGYGAIAGATLYDIIKTSGTANGLPEGVSGLNIINIGADLPYKKLMLSADLYKFRASKNANGGSLQVASEWDLKATYLMGENLSINAVYAVFTPLGLYPTAKTANLVGGGITAKF